MLRKFKHRTLKAIILKEIIFLCQLGIKKEMFDLTFKREYAIAKDLI